MPELPEVEVLVRHLAPLLRGRRIRAVQVRRARVLGRTGTAKFRRALRGATFLEVSRRGKYLLFTLSDTRRNGQRLLVGHLGMSGRMYLSPAKSPLPKHAAVVLNLGKQNFIFEDTRYFGRMTFDAASLATLGPEPLSDSFTPETLAEGFKDSTQPVKVKLLNQELVAGIGNIYASEALFRAGLSPRTAARRLTPARIQHLWRAIRETLSEAIRLGSTVPLNYAGTGRRDGLFYFGRAPGHPAFYEERLRVYDREGKPCRKCGRPIRRLVQAGRSTYYCVSCQRA
jgi:formamidopyrimidine-DNA glycosylase